MRIIKNIKTMAACCVLCLTACQQDEFRSATSGHVPVRFAPERVTAALTRVTDDEWDNDDEIGIYMVPATSGEDNGESAGTDLTKDANEASNIHYVITQNDSETILTAADGTEPIYYPVSGESVGFVAYYPYSAKVLDEGVYKVNVQTQSAPAASDLLYAKTTTGYNKQSTDPVELNFTHKLSRLILKVVPDANINTDLSETEATLKGFPTTADFDLKTGELSNIGGEEDIVLDDVAGNTEDEAKFTVIIVPHDGDYYTRTVDFSIDGMVYTYEFGDGFDFTAGISTECTLTFTGTRLKLTSTTITLGYQNGETNSVEISSSATLDPQPRMSCNIDGTGGTPEWLGCVLQRTGDLEYGTNWNMYELTVTSTSAHMTNDGSSTRTAYIHLKGADKNEVITVTQESSRLLMVQPSTTNVDVPALGQNGNTFTITTNWPGMPEVSTSANPVIQASSLQISQAEGGADLDGNLKWIITFNSNTWEVPVGTYCPARNANIVVEIDDFKQNISVTQSAYKTTVEDGMSNCYVLDREGSVTFSVKRAYYSVDNRTLRVDPTTTYDAEFDVNVLWQDNVNVVDECTVTGAGPDAQITIKAGTGQGNAVVALKREGGEIVWSYHIWRSSVTICNKWLDSTIGTCLLESLLETDGLAYQWGRKDPFPTSGEIPNLDGGCEIEKLVDLDVYESIKNPKGFETSTWHGCDGEKSWNDENKKTVHDPCPAGYTVPSKGDKPTGPWTYVSTSPASATDPAAGLWIQPKNMNPDGNVNSTGAFWVNSAAATGDTADMWLPMYETSGTPPIVVPSKFTLWDGPRGKRFGCAVRCIAETMPL